MGNNKFKKIVKQYGGLLLAFVVILLALVFYSLKNFEPVVEESVDLTPLTAKQSVPQFPVLFSSEGGLEAKVIYDQSSMYGQVMVFDYADDIRTLMIDGAVPCTWNFENQKATTHVHEIAEVLKNNLADKQDILIIGLGCGGLLKELAGEDFNLDVVEINPEVVVAAEKYFSLPEDLNYMIREDDGLHWLRNQDKKYDVIIVDLCDILETNVHLYTQEFYELVSSKLKDDQSWLIQSLNIYRQGDEYEVHKRVANSILKHFNYVYTTPRTMGVQKFIVLNFFATNQALETKDNSFIAWPAEPEGEIINYDNSFLIVQYYLPVINRLRQQAIDNFGFDIHFK